MDRVSRVEVLRASPPLFESRWLDRLTRVRPFVPPLIFGPAILLVAAAAIARLSGGDAVLAFVGGYAFWTLCEYWIHRVVFHLQPRSRHGARLHWIVHGVHHDHPNDPLRLVMPPIVTVPLGTAFLGLFVLVLGTPIAWGVAAGFFAGYLFYDLLHYRLHHARSKRRVGRWLRQLHMRHHFEDDTRCFGVSAPWWDTVFGTSTHRGRPVKGRR